MTETTPGALAGRLKTAVGELNMPPEKDGAGVDAVIERVAGETEYTEANVRDALNRLLKDGEVYLPAAGRVRVTPR
jgi:hypothetical protein